MNAQDIHNLQEAYMEVVMNELDESRGDDLRKKHRLKPGEVSKILSRRANIKTFKYERSDPKRDALSYLSGFAGARSEGDDNLHTTSERVRRGGRPSGTDIHTHSNRDRGNKGERFADFVQGKRDSPNMSDTERNTVNFGRTSRYKKEEADLYDIILSHLLDEGYAETPEAAEAIMVNMSEDWREDIVEGRGEDLRAKYGSNPAAKLSKKAFRKAMSYNNRDRLATGQTGTEARAQYLGLSGSAEARSNNQTPIGSAYDSQGRSRRVRSRGGGGGAIGSGENRDRPSRYGKKKQR